MPDGCDASLGIVDGWRGPRLQGSYICDGSVMPAAVGANPSLTIAAFAERTAQRIIAAA